MIDISLDFQLLLLYRVYQYTSMLQCSFSILQYYFMRR